MKKPLRSLPPAKRRELDHAVAVLRQGFAEATATRKAPRLKDGRILKIILFGSYARGDWVHDPVGRYFSDFDLLVVVDHEDLTDWEFWQAAEDRLLADMTAGQGLGTPVSLIVHSLDDVNHRLEHGRSFFIDIVRDGVTLFDTAGVDFVQPQPLPPATALKEARDTYDEMTESVSEFLETAEFTRRRGFTRKTAFLLHQATETLYSGLLLVLTGYSPKSHKLTSLRKLTEPLVPGLADAWPHETKLQRRSFELLRAAYVKGRYSKHFKITDEELGYLFERIARLRATIEDASSRRLSELAGASVCSPSAVLPIHPDCLDLSANRSPPRRVAQRYQEIFMALSRIATVVGGLLLSKGRRRFAGRHAGKLALATLAWELFQQHRARQTPATGQTQHQGRTPRPSPRPRWRAARTSSR